MSREQLINSAAAFINHPSVQSSSTEAKVSFLKEKKGLTDGEVQLALERAAANRESTASSQSAPPTFRAAPVPVAESANRSLLSQLRNMVVLACLGYVGLRALIRLLVPLRIRLRLQKRAHFFLEAVTTKQVADFLIGNMDEIENDGEHAVKMELHQTQDRLANILEVPRLSHGVSYSLFSVDDPTNSN